MDPRRWAPAAALEESSGSARSGTRPGRPRWARLPKCCRRRWPPPPGAGDRAGAGCLPLANPRAPAGGGRRGAEQRESARLGRPSRSASRKDPAAPRCAAQLRNNPRYSKQQREFQNYAILGLSEKIISYFFVLFPTSSPSAEILLNGAGAPVAAR